MDFGPHGSADVTENLTESVLCGPVVHDPAEPEQDVQGLPFLHIKAPFHALDSPTVKEAVSFVESRLYNAFLNNCIQNTDFLVRVLTGGAVRNAPLIFDALCGHVPPQDNPMLLMFMLMTRMSWFDVCDGGKVAAAYLEDHATPAVPHRGKSAEAAAQAAGEQQAAEHADKAQKHTMEETPESANKTSTELPECRPHVKQQNGSATAS
ncbi:hypothetical protein CVIRNUC_009133 [Coccomyxa viridis]|uniref:PPPDE domain-containing protein n=1 Tax=Coccomyxa viridis TaxID=1274662 RepID=A0AAV1IHJ1_9CHLO|nr:hypothetical protein CVIRNUC_009133 [Coccomyxa viridis]